MQILVLLTRLFLFGTEIKRQLIHTTWWTLWPILTSQPNPTLAAPLGRHCYDWHPLVVTPVPVFAKLLRVFPFALLLLLLLSVPERFTVLIYRVCGAAQHTQVILIKLPLFGRVFWRSLQTRVSLNLPAFQDVKGDLEKRAGEAVFLGGAEVRTCIPALEPTNQQTSLSYDHAFIWFDLERRTQLLLLQNKSHCS